jgi:hypothetical protein
MAIRHCVIPQKSAYLTNIAAEAWKQGHQYKHCLTQITWLFNKALTVLRQEMATQSRCYVITRWTCPRIDWLAYVYLCAPQLITSLSEYLCSDEGGGGWWRRRLEEMRVVHRLEDIVGSLKNYMHFIGMRRFHCLLRVHCKDARHIEWIPIYRRKSCKCVQCRGSHFVWFVPESSMFLLSAVIGA